MSLRIMHIRVLLFAGLIAFPAGATGQHPSHQAAARAEFPRATGAVHAVALLTRATPTAGGRSLTEAYLTQPALSGMVEGRGGRLQAMAMVNLEGLTLARGELTTGAYGEGYVDRRHPHTYLHELIVTARTSPAAGHALSLSAGRGFATFGSDDPMIRPFVKFPVNHHLAQVLERGLAAGAARVGVVGVEASIFNGNEPTRASDLPTVRRIGDSWAMRLTLYPLEGLELSASHAAVASPEVAAGFGLDSRKWHGAARWERGALYALAEWARSTEHDGRANGGAAESILAEASYRMSWATAAIRAEQTDRHEEERLADPFRTPPSTGGSHAIGRTTWRTVTLNVSRRLSGGGLAWVPFVEVAAIRPDRRSGVLFEPREFYGARTLAMLSAGMRLAAGAWHGRMGRYGAASATSQPHH